MLEKFIDKLDSARSLDRAFLDSHDFIITFGFYAKGLDKDFKSDICLHPFLHVKTDFYIRYEVGSEEGVAALLLYEATKEADSTFNKELDCGYLSAESNVSSEEIEEIISFLKNAKSPMLLVGSDIYLHNRANNILNILAKLPLEVYIASYDNTKIYRLKQIDSKLDSAIEIGEYNGCIIYLNHLNNANTLIISSEFAKAWRVENNEKVEVSFENHKLDCTCKLDSTFGGVVGILNADISDTYPYKKIALKKR